MPRSRTELGYRLGIAAGEGRLNEVQRLLAADADTEARVPIMGMMMSSLNAAAYTNHVSRPRDLKWCTLGGVCGKLTEIPSPCHASLCPTAVLLMCRRIHDLREIEPSARAVIRVAHIPHAFLPRGGGQYFNSMFVQTPKCEIADDMPSMYSHRLGQGQVVKVLIKAGADVNSRQSTGHTPLHCCAMEGQPGMMSDLLQAGADPTLASVEGQTALHTAAQVTTVVASVSCEK